MMNEKIYKKSRYTVRHETADGILILYNTLSGAIATVDQPTEREEIKHILRAGLVKPPQNENERLLVENDFLVKPDLDERVLADVYRNQEKYRSDHYELTLYSTEECNFRCVYCFEKFLRGEMSKDIQNSVIKHVLKKAPYMNSFNIAWFGGEPLEGIGAIKHINSEIKKISEEFNFKFTSGITTNGYNLDVDLFKELVGLNITQYQITLDGPKDTHDTHRILKGGGPSFDKIVENLKAIQKTNLEFNILIRSNFDKTNQHRMQELIELLQTFLNGDERFRLYFKPIINFEGESAKDLLLYQPNESWQAMSEVQSLAHCHFPTSPELLNSLQPMGSACFAGLPNNFAIGADGTIYKCTLALHEPFNQLGKINEDGDLDIDSSKFALWVTSDATHDTQCNNCFLKPSCQGMHCPLIRIRTQKSPCPPLKKNIRTALELVSVDAGI
ncbi:radical SAM/SPASM domain-containing protein [Bacillus cereus]|uniref:radical SAM/SPASM domain-containing protein n=1 Tax=Bacillus cereus TaxID=1396 RepID=UPI0005393288|nr:radical SAM protein [Bacillus cereus]WPA86215.1 radical SAM protein [Bacillus cereus]